MYVLNIAVRCVLATAFVVLCLVQAKRLGVAGAILLSAIAALDASIALAYFVLSFVDVHPRGIDTMLDALDVLFNLASTVCIVVAMISLRARSSVRG